MKLQVDLVKLVQIQFGCRLLHPADQLFQFPDVDWRDPVPGPFYGECFKLNPQLKDLSNFPGPQLRNDSALVGSLLHETLMLKFYQSLADQGNTRAQFVRNSTLHDLIAGTDRAG